MAGALLIVCGIAAALPPTPAMDGLPPTYDDETLVARPTVSVPVIDGTAEPLWAGADTLEVVATGASGNWLPGSGVHISAFHNYSWMYFLITWADAAPDRGLDTWLLTDNSTPGGVWNRTGWGEDAFSIYFDDGQGAEQNFSASGCTALCHTSPNEMSATSPSGMLDLWHWSAARTDALGIADDRFLDNASKSTGSATGGLHPDVADPFVENNMTTAYGPRPAFLNGSAPATADHIVEADEQPINWSTFDSGTLPVGTQVPAWVLTPPAPGEGDVVAAASHNGTGWTLELARPFVTGDASGHDISVASLDTVYYFSVALTNNRTLDSHSVPLLPNKLVFADNLLPDYVIRSAAPLAPTVETGTPGNVSTLVRNNGFTDATAPLAVAVFDANMTEVGRSTGSGVAWGKERVVPISFSTTGLAPGNYTYTVVADVDDGEAESNESNNAYSFNLSVVAPVLLPDLVLSNLTGPAGPVFVPDNATVTGTVTNSGPGDTATNVTLRVSNMSFAPATIDIGLLPAGASVDFTLNASSAGVPSGSYFLTVTADPDNTINEGGPGELNNAGTVVATVEARPDLAAVRVTVFPAAVQAGDPVDLNVTIANNGGAISQLVTVWTYLDNATSVGSNDRVLVWTADVSLSHGEIAVVSVPWDVPGGLPVGSHSVRMWLDGPQALAEISELNNNASGALIILEPPRPNLYISAALTDSYDYSIGDTVGIAINVSNSGVASTQPVVLEVRDALSDQTLATATVPPVPAGGLQTVTASFIVPSAVPGAHLLTLVVDPNDTLAEENELDNSYTLSYTVLEPLVPDLAVAAVSATPPAPVSGDSVLLSAHVTNEGTGAAVETTGQFRLGATLLGTVTIPMLGAGSGATVTYTWDTTGYTGLQALIVFVADPGGLVAETDRSDNQASLTLLFTRPGEPSWHLLPMTVAPEVVNEGTLVRIEVVALNNGSVSGTAAVRFLVDGVAVANESITLDPGTNRTLRANWTANASGTHFLRAEVLVGKDVVDATTRALTVQFTEGVPPQDNTWVTIVVIIVAGSAGAFAYLRMRRPPGRKPSEGPAEPSPAPPPAGAPAETS